jgi:predicted metal-dependent phosphoesterase TrpH
VHSWWSDGAQAPQTLVKRAAGRLDALAITDHDDIRGALVARQFARARPELGIEVVVGEEISTRNGHLLGLFLEERIPPGLTALATIQRIHAQGGLAVVAHPCHPMNVRDRGARCLTDLIGDLPLYGIEAVNNAGFFSWLYDAIAALRNLEWALPVTGGSDAHDAWYVGSGLTRFEGRRAEDLRRALLAAGREPRSAGGGPPTRCRGTSRSSCGAWCGSPRFWPAASHSRGCGGCSERSPRRW